MRRTLAILIAFIAANAGARVLLTQEQALATAFPNGVKIARQKFFLTPQQLADAKRESGVDFNDQLIVRYASSDGRIAYFDTHRVRTLPETVMVVVTPDGKLERV